MADVFISYARSDKAVAARVARGLQAGGFDVWWDADLPAHRAYSEVIERNLDEARAVVVLWSKAAAGSQWVRAEADFARNAGKLVQAGVDGSIPPLPFNQIQCADLKGWRGGPSHAGWAKLRASVRSLVSGEDGPAHAAKGLPVLDRIRASRWALAAAFTLLLAAFGLFLFLARPGEEKRPVLAVLPFRSLDAQDASLVAGIWEDTRTAIGRNPQILVLGPNTVQELAQKGEGAATRAADYLLQASVRTAGDRIRVSADLVRTRDGEQVWSEDFDRRLDDVFALQSQIAGEIEGRIRGRLAERGGITPEHIATSGEVYALYSDARAKIRKREPAGTVAAHKQLEQVVRMDPNFAPGWAALAVVVSALPPSQLDWTLTAPAESYARKAIELAPNLAAGHAALARTLGLKGPVARAEVERAVALDPSDYEALTWLGNMRSDAGDKKGAIEAYRRVTDMEPFFWPAVLNLYSAYKDLNDEAAIQELLARENRVGATFLAAGIQIENAFDKGNLAEAVNLGLRYLSSDKNVKSPMLAPLWVALIQLGYPEQAAKLGAPDFAPLLWKLDPRGLDLMESHKIPPRGFFSLDPLTENAARVYLLSGRGRKLVDLYFSLKLPPEEVARLMLEAGTDHFLYSAPLIVIALNENGHPKEAKALLSIAEARAREGLAGGQPLDSVQLARVYAVEGRKDDVISLLTQVISRGWIPEAPMLLPDLHADPALAGLKGDPRFERLRDRIMGTIARERAQVDLKLLAGLRDVASESP